jgi:hypothetical protein
MSAIGVASARNRERAFAGFLTAHVGHECRDREFAVVSSARA